MTTTEKFQSEIVSERSYRDGQGYGMTQLWKVRERLVGGAHEKHTLRIIVKQGNSRAYASAKVERWDGTQWHLMVFLNGYEMDEGPSYVAWARRVEDCIEWLRDWSEQARVFAMDVLR